MGLLKTVEEWRGQGCAKACTNNLAEFFQSIGIKPFVYIEHDNHVSIKLFEKMGYKQTHKASWICYLPKNELYESKSKEEKKYCCK